MKKECDTRYVLGRDAKTKCPTQFEKKNVLTRSPKRNDKNAKSKVEC